ncbi:MAG TPA: hypothetical protein PLI83_02720 [Thermomonas sp.]|nr:hypothetical protein [Thermomonas sp.]
MSATNRGGARRQDDAYLTPEWCVEALLREVQLPGGTWLEPAAGEGAIIRAVRAVRKDVVWNAIDIRPECRPHLVELCGESGCGIGDFLTDWRWTCWQSHSVIITNPPYTHAMEYVRHCLQHPATIAMLLRLNFLGSQRRAGFFRERCPDVYVLPRRPSFTHGGTDSCEYAWFVWSPVAQTVGRIRVLEVP